VARSDGHVIRDEADRDALVIELGDEGSQVVEVARLTIQRVDDDLVALAEVGDEVAQGRAVDPSAGDVVHEDTVGVDADQLALDRPINRTHMNVADDPP